MLCFSSAKLINAIGKRDTSYEILITVELFDIHLNIIFQRNSFLIDYKFWLPTLQGEESYKIL